MGGAGFSQPALCGVHRFTGTRLMIAEGRGTEENPLRIVTYWIDDDGEIIHRKDPAAQSEAVNKPNPTTPED